MTDKDPDLAVSFFKERVQLCNGTSTRARYAVLLSAMLFIGLSLVMYDYFFTWNRSFAFQTLNEMANGAVVANPMRDRVLAEWMSTQVYQLPFLGIKIMASDLPVLAPIGLIMCSVWVFFIVRREHYTTARLLNDVYAMYHGQIEKGIPRAFIFVMHVYHCVISHTVFNVIGHDQPVASLMEPLRASRPNNSLPLATRISTWCATSCTLAALLFYLVYCAYSCSEFTSVSFPHYW